METVWTLKQHVVPALLSAKDNSDDAYSFAKAFAPFFDGPFLAAVGWKKAKEVRLEDIKRAVVSYATRARDDNISLIKLLDALREYYELTGVELCCVECLMTPTTSFHANWIYAANDPALCSTRAVFIEPKFIFRYVGEYTWYVLERSDAFYVNSYNVCHSVHHSVEWYSPGCPTKNESQTLFC